MCISVTETDQLFVILPPTYCTKPLCVAVSPPYFFARQMHFLSCYNICNVTLQFRGNINLMLLLLRVSTTCSFTLVEAELGWLGREPKGLKYKQKGLAESERTAFHPSNFLLGFFFWGAGVFYLNWMIFY